MRLYDISLESLHPQRETGGGPLGSALNFSTVVSTFSIFNEDPPTGSAWCVVGTSYRFPSAVFMQMPANRDRRERADHTGRILALLEDEVRRMDAPLGDHARWVMVVCRSPRG